MCHVWCDHQILILPWIPHYGLNGMQVLTQVSVCLLAIKIDRGRKEKKTFEKGKKCK